MKQQILTGDTIETTTTSTEPENKPDYWTREACTVPAARIDWTGHTEHKRTSDDEARFATLYTYTKDGKKYAGESIDILENDEIIIVPITHEDGSPYYYNGTYHRITITENNVKQLVCDDKGAYQICG